MTPVQFLGIDPGPTPGIVLYRHDTPPLIVQCSAVAAAAVLAGLLAYDEGCPTVVQIERFVIGRRASRSSTAAAGEVTRNLIEGLRHTWEGYDSTSHGRLGGRWLLRAAAQVKPWATDERLNRAGLLAPTKGMPHARDAARHALFVACHDGGVTDPLSKEFAS